MAKQFLFSRIHSVTDRKDGKPNFSYPLYSIEDSEDVKLGKGETDLVNHGEVNIKKLSEAYTAISAMLSEDNRWTSEECAAEGLVRYASLALDPSRAPKGRDKEQAAYSSTADKLLMGGGLTITQLDAHLKSDSARAQKWIAGKLTSKDEVYRSIGAELAKRYPAQ
jgi:hypothetical protein